MMRIPGSTNLQDISNQPISDKRHATPPKIKTTPQKRYLYGLCSFSDMGRITSATRVGETDEEHSDGDEQDRPGQFWEILSHERVDADANQ